MISRITKQNFWLLIINNLKTVKLSHAIRSLSFISWSRCPSRYFQLLSRESRYLCYATLSSRSTIPRPCSLFMNYVKPLWGGLICAYRNFLKPVLFSERYLKICTVFAILFIREVLSSQSFEQHIKVQIIHCLFNYTKLSFSPYYPCILITLICHVKCFVNPIYERLKVSE